MDLDDLFAGAASPPGQLYDSTSPSVYASTLSTTEHLSPLNQRNMPAPSRNKNGNGQEKKPADEITQNVSGAGGQHGPAPEATAQKTEMRSEENALLANAVPYHELPAEVIQTEGNIFSEGGARSFRNNMTLWDTSLVLITNQVGLGILSLPAIMHVLGLIPGIIAIIGLGILTTYTGFVLLQVYRRYPNCVNIVDMGKAVGGRPLEIIVATGLMIKICLTCASASVTLSVAFNTMSGHVLCTVTYIGIAAASCWLLCLPREFKWVAHVGIPATVSIVAAVLIVLISLGIADPRGAPPGFEKEIVLFGNPDFRTGLTACLNLAFAFAGNVSFPSLFPEMRNPSQDFFKSLVILQLFSVPLYMLVGVGIYCLAGQYTASPALGSAPEIPAKVAYGIVVPAVLATGLVFGHTAVKYMYVVIMRALKSTNQMTDNSIKAWTVWVCSGTVFWIAAFVLANAIPIFNSILSISSATFAAWFCFGISGVFWLFLNWGKLFSTWRKVGLTILNVLIIIQALFMNAAGLWAAITKLIDIFNRGEEGVRGPFTCADNSLL
jgi:amino acid permease